jgi:hypothetical protein
MVKKASLNTLKPTQVIDTFYVRKSIVHTRFYVDISLGAS